MMPADTILYIWWGGDPDEGFLNEVPARTLTQFDYDDLPAERQAAVQHQATLSPGLYTNA